MMRKSVTKKAAKSAATKTKNQRQATKAVKDKRKAAAGSSSKPKGKTNVTAKKPKEAKGVAKKQKKATVAAAVRALFEERGLDGVTFDDALKAARKALPSSRFAKSHYAWYRSKFKKAAATARGAR
jgi:hypothetical protein